MLSHQFYPGLCAVLRAQKVAWPGEKLDARHDPTSAWAKRELTVAVYDNGATRSKKMVLLK